MNNSITTWKEFSRKVRVTEKEFLRKVEDFSPFIFVAGCQRSGTTALTTIINKSENFGEYSVPGVSDSELAGALILSDMADFEFLESKRYCIQTTYLNERYPEYFDHKGNFKLIFFIRNPYSVVYSMRYNWIRRREFRNFPLNELFKGCGLPYMDEAQAKRYDRLGVWGIPRIQKACLAYKGKVLQAIELQERLGDDMIVIDYDRLVLEKERLLPQIFEFIDEPYLNSYAGYLRASSLSKQNRLSGKEVDIIGSLCMSTYDQVKQRSI